MRRDPSRYLEYEYRAELARRHMPGGSAFWVFLVEWRREGTRNWQTFVLVPHERDSFVRFANKVGPAIEAQAARLARPVAT